MKNSKKNKNELLPLQQKNDFDAGAALEWFNSFEKSPDIFDSYTNDELKDLKNRMLLDLKNKINKID